MNVHQSKAFSYTKPEETDRPLLSVVMPVYNGEKYLREAIESVLNQTFKDFELIIINDGSKDGSEEIIKGIKDPRIRYLDNGVNRGIPYTRNVGLTEAKGDFLAWCDCDDLLMPTRFERQLAFLKTHDNYGACGTWIARFGGQKDNVFKSSSDPEYVKSMLLFKPSVPNATVMLRMSKIRALEILYNMDLPIAEDYDFILRCSRHFPIANIQEVLYKYRASETSIMRQFEEKEQESYRIHKIVYKEALSTLDINPGEDQLKRHWLITSEKLLDKLSDLKACFEWLQYLQEQNLKIKSFDPKTFKKVLADQFYFASKKTSQVGLPCFFFYLKKAPVSFGWAGLTPTLKLLARCLIKYDKF